MILRFVIMVLVVSVPTSLWVAMPRVLTIPQKIASQYSYALPQSELEVSSADIISDQNSSIFQEAVDNTIISNQTSTEVGNVENTPLELPNTTTEAQVANKVRRVSKEAARRVSGEPPTTISDQGENTQPPTVQPEDIEQPEDEHLKSVSITYKPQLVTTTSISKVPTARTLDLIPTVNLIGFSASSLPPSSNNVYLNQTFSVDFPTTPSPEVIKSIQFYPKAPFTTNLDGNKLTITPTLKRASTYTLGYQKTEVCKPDVGIECVPENSWLYALSFTTTPKESLVYGKSFQGRDLVANIFGSCTVEETCKRIMLTGGLHGSEWRSGDLTNLQSYIEQNPQEIIGKNKEIIIVPFANPDGTALNIRYNARAVNLNRNFPLNYVNCDQCGAVALSEPESKALVDFTFLTKPDYLISYHAQWPPDGIIFKGDDNNPQTQVFAQWVADRTGYSVGYFNDPGSVVNGDQTVWAESIGIRSIIIEATNINSSDWSKNYNMYLGLLRDL